MESRITELEMKLTFQEQTVDELNKVVYEQQKEIEQLKAAVNLLKEQLKSLTDTGPGQNPADEKPPPHY